MAHNITIAEAIAANRLHPDSTLNDQNQPIETEPETFSPAALEHTIAGFAAARRGELIEGEVAMARLEQLIQSRSGQ